MNIKDYLAISITDREGLYGNKIGDCPYCKVEIRHKHDYIVVMGQPVHKSCYGDMTNEIAIARRKAGLTRKQIREQARQKAKEEKRQQL